MRVIDLTYLHSVSEGNEELERSLAEIFLSQIPEFSQGMTDAYSNGNFIQLASIAHKAKSSVQAMGMEQLASSLKILEMFCKQVYVEQCETNGLNDSRLQWYKDQIKSMPTEMQKTISNYKEKKVATEVMADLIKFYNLQADMAKLDILDTFPYQSTK